MGRNQIILVTGSTSGLGLSLAKELAGRGFDLILHGRNFDKLEFLKQEIQETNSCKVYTWRCDFLDKKKVFSSLNVAGLMPMPDFVIHNASFISSQRILSNDNHEGQLQVNFILPVLITNYLIERSDKKMDFLFVTSRAHKRAVFYSNDIDLATNYSTTRAYNQSKLLLMNWIDVNYNDFKKKNVKIYSVHPGLMNTEIGSKNVEGIELFLWNILKLGGNKPSFVASQIVKSFFSENSEIEAGAYYDMYGDKLKPALFSKDSENLKIFNEYVKTLKF